MIILSPGHWKIGTGAKSIIDEVTEARKVVSAMQQLLKKQQVAHAVIVDNVSHSKATNLSYLVKEHSRYKDGLHVSVHFNSVGGGVRQEGIGCEVLYASDQTKQIAQQVVHAICGASQLKNRGIKFRNDLKWLNTFKTNGILIEVCFVNSVTDVNNYRKNFNAICEAIVGALTNKIVKPSIHELVFQSKAVDQKVKSLLAKKERMRLLLECGVNVGAINASWLKKYPHQISEADLLGLCLLILDDLVQ